MNNDFLEVSELYHFGVKGMKWGVRRYLNEDGTLTEEGKQRYGSVENMRRSVQKELNRTDQAIGEEKRYEYHATNKLRRINRRIERNEEKGNEEKVAKLEAKKEETNKKLESIRNNIDKADEYTNNLIKTMEKNGFDVNSKQIDREVNTTIEKILYGIATFGVSAIVPNSAGYSYTGGNKYKIKSKNQ